MLTEKRPKSSKYYEASLQSKYKLDQDEENEIQEIPTVKSEINATSEQLAVYSDQGYQGYSGQQEEDYSADCSDLFPQGGKKEI